jgi:iron(III) transport system substrate-binding protein
MLHSFRQGRQSAIYPLPLSLAITFHAPAQADWTTNCVKPIFSAVSGALRIFVIVNLLMVQELRGASLTEWEQTVKAAEKEGQLTVYISGYVALLDGGYFQKAFPKIKVTGVSGEGSQLAPRIVSERRAGRYLADVYSGGGNSIYQVLYLGKMLDPIKPALLLPEVVDESKWWEGKHKYVDRERQHMFVYEGNVSAGATPGYNVNLLNPREFKSYWDFLNPKLKGKIVSIDIRQVRGAGLPWQYLYYNPELGPPYLKRLHGEMDVTMAGDIRQAIDWLATGKFTLCIPCRNVARGKHQGLPIDDFEPYHLKEGISLSSAYGQVVLMNRAPHPNAAKVFINWLLSREGQIAFQKVLSLPEDPKDSRRVDVPKDHIPLQDRRKDGMKYFDLDDPDTKDIRPVMKLLDEVLAGKK